MRVARQLQKRNNNIVCHHDRTILENTRIYLGGHSIEIEIIITIKRSRFIKSENLKLNKSAEETQKIVILNRRK